MAELSVQDAAFTGFRLVREHPRALGVWALYAIVLSLTSAVLFVGLAGPDFTRLMALNAAPSKDPAAILQIFGRLAPFYLIFVVVIAALNAVMVAAMIRAVLQPAEHRFGYVRLGADELRQFGLSLLSFLVFMGAYLGLALLAGIIVGVAALLAKAAAIALTVIAVMAVIAALVVLAVRLSLAPPLTFDTGRIDLFGSWRLTAGHFWKLAGTYLLALLLAVVVLSVGAMLTFTVGALLNGGDVVAAMAKQDMSSLQAYFTPYRMIQIVLRSGISALTWPVILTPPSAIYRSLSHTGGAAADVFS